MRTWALLLPALLFAAPAARADDSSDIQAVITHQLDAFAHDDAEGAYAFAAPGIKTKFPDAAAFFAMVKSTYPPVYRHRSFQFGKTTQDGDRTEQGVAVVDDENNVWGGVYVLERQPDGAWRISGCVLMRSTETSL